MRSQRLVCEVSPSLSYFVYMSDNQIRCTAQSDNLDNDPHRLPCNREHTNTLVEMLELGELWDEYGLVGDVVVN